MASARRPRPAIGQRRYGPDEIARVHVLRELLGLGLTTVEDLRGIADRIQLMVEDPGRRCANADATSPASGVVERRPAAIDSEIDRLSRVRARPAQRTGRA